jgi:hypothetical protein
MFQASTMMIKEEKPKPTVVAAGTKVDGGISHILNE